MGNPTEAAPIRPAAAPDAPTDTTRVVLRLAPPQIVDLHCLLEGYDDLAVLRTLDGAAGLVEVFVSPGLEPDFERLRLALCDEGLPTEIVPEAA
jgi:hypothetical protein